MPLEMGARVDKIGINAQYAKICQESKGKIDYDKSFIHLPRQYTGNSLKSAYFQGIFDVGFVDLHRFYTV